MSARNGSKRLISVRIGQGDHAKVKQLAARLGARESEVLRFALKSTLARLNPLYQPDSGGREVLSVFIEHGDELVRYFELDADRLDEIVNAPVSDPDERVDREDLTLIAAGLSDHYVGLKLGDIRGEKIDPEQLAAELRRYLLGKYVRPTGG